MVEENKGENTTIKVGEQVLTVAQVQELLAQNETLSSSIKELSPLKELADKYEVTPEELLKEAQGSFALMNKLMQDGILDKDGKVVVKEPAPSKFSKPPKSSEDGDDDLIPRSKLEDTLKGYLKPFVKELDSLKEANDRVAGATLKTDLKLQYGKDFSEDVFNEAVKRTRKNPEKNFFEHASMIVEEFKKTKVQDELETEERILKKYGFDPGKVRDGLKEATPETVVDGRKLSFKAKEGEKGMVHPRDATKSFLSKVFGKNV